MTCGKPSVTHQTSEALQLGHLLWSLVCVNSMYMLVSVVSDTVTYQLPMPENSQTPEP